MAEDFIRFAESTTQCHILRVTIPKSPCAASPGGQIAGAGTGKVSPFAADGNCPSHHHDFPAAENRFAGIGKVFIYVLIELAGLHVQFPAPDSLPVESQNPWQPICDMMLSESFNEERCCPKQHRQPNHKAADQQRANESSRLLLTAPAQHCEDQADQRHHAIIASARVAKSARSGTVNPAPVRY